MSVQAEPVGAQHDGFPALYAEVLRFYARQMRFLDDGAAEEWALTFTEDGMFAPPSLPEPLRGRGTLAAGVKQAKAEMAESGEVHRHVVSMVDVQANPDGSVEARSYVQVIATPRGGEPNLYMMTTCHDVLVRDGGELRVSERRVRRDDRPSA
ncbi:3-phenylpropionate/cinnamic acid dioxygenase small subunit [Saccharothrix ecbatanensis]|jgi:3-phenylpropionate/cinnamic acid dioxygenase small subunit|uniref:3-phenylpropionate/cinnamic acid dioxygenase small subunit n=1 Tax=Saccharothrix ecbatanensis TaxID=1105145 RepID=A0A7W9M008_9PSEU|nr:nuclear transport factor 2 family protein [Saccharothrix ecbatanensis]MBB5802227.1 3-phenylpropionate/cinnamic acid dioxygenase small subunit [Saccharothrix ecbatanensis]